MQEVNDSAIPRGAGIITFEMLYKAMAKMQIEIKNIKERLDKLEKAPEPIKETKKKVKK